MILTMPVYCGVYEEPDMTLVKNQSILHLLSDSDTRSLVKRIIKLIRKYEGAEDPLSKDLVKWGREVCTIALYHAKEEEFVDRLAAKVNEIRSVAIG